MAAGLTIVTRAATGLVALALVVCLPSRVRAQSSSELLQDAQRLAMEDVAIIPLHIQTNIWAMRRGLAHTPRADELTRAQDIRPAAAQGASGR